MTQRCAPSSAAACYGGAQNWPAPPPPPPPPTKMRQDFPQAAARALLGNPPGDASTGLASGTHSEASLSDELPLLAASWLKPPPSPSFGERGGDASRSATAPPEAAAGTRTGDAGAVPSEPERSRFSSAPSPFHAPDSTMRLARMETCRSRDRSSHAAAQRTGGP